MQSTANAFADYFRCPDHLGEFGTNGELSADSGYFMFHNTICYGQRSGGLPSRDVTGSLPDVSHAVTWEERRLCLPFDLSRVVTNLQQEHYRQHSDHYFGKMTKGSAARRAYYFFRPVLSVAVRKHLQKIRLRGWDKIPFPRWPVDVSVETLMQSAMALLLKGLGIEKIPFIWFWPDGAHSCGIMTHDVETTAGLDFCGDLMDLDDSSRIKSSFQIIPEGRYEISQRFMENLRSRGFEVNVHDLNHDGALFRSRQQFLQRAVRINQYARQFQSRGFRAGAMYREQQWYDALEFSYDMSVPNVAHLEPQRGGCCTVMPYFVGKILELPLTTVQDYSLFHILHDYSIALWKKQIELIRVRNGLISFITHPDYLIERRARAVYLDLLAHLRQLRDEGKMWVALAGDVDRWWRTRSLMTLVRDGDSWHIEGTDSHRARVAWATLENDRLVYKLDRPS